MDKDKLKKDLGILSDQINSKLDGTAAFREEQGADFFDADAMMSTMDRNSAMNPLGRSNSVAKKFNRFSSPAIGGI